MPGESVMSGRFNVVSWNVQRSPVSISTNDINDIAANRRTTLIKEMMDTFSVVLLQEAPKPLWTAAVNGQLKDWYVDGRLDNQSPNNPCKTMLYCNEGASKLVRVPFTSGAKGAYRYPTSIQAELGNTGISLLFVSLHATSGMNGLSNTYDAIDDIAEEYVEKSGIGNQSKQASIAGLVLGGDLNSYPKGAAFPNGPTNQGATNNKAIDGFYVYSGAKNGLNVDLQVTKVERYLNTGTRELLCVNDAPKVGGPQRPGFSEKYTGSNQSIWLHLSDHCPVYAQISVTVTREDDDEDMLSN